MTVLDARTPARPTGAGERRPITVLFADIAGSTSIAERLDPEDWTVLIGQAFERMNSTIEHYGGDHRPPVRGRGPPLFRPPPAHPSEPRSRGRWRARPSPR